MNSKVSPDLKSLSAKIAGELVFAEAGKNLGLLPLNSLVGQIEQLLETKDAPEPVAKAVRLARQWVDETLETTGVFSVSSLERFGEWAGWMQTAAQALENGADIPALPARWETAGIEAGVPQGDAPEPSAGAAETELTLNIAEDGELLGEFINESEEHLQNIEQGVLVLEENPRDAETLDSIFRAFHTFKGGSGFLNLTCIQTLAHELESLLDLARQHKLTITPDIINLILAGGDTLKHFMAEIGSRLAGKNAASPIRVPTGQLLERIRAVLSGVGAPAAARSAAPTPQAAPAVIAPVAPVSADSPASSTVVPLPETKPDNAARAKANPSGAVIKVDTLKLDSLIDLVGELAIAQSLIIQNGDLKAIRNERLTRDLSQLAHISKDLQRTAMSLRMVPISGTFQKMNRLVRDLTAKVGKPVELVTAGEDTEVDRTIVEEISDPLVHMIRNSVDHGIEKPELRQQRGKPPVGRVSLRAFHQGGSMVIEISDDGNGLNRERIFAKAVEKKLVKADDDLSDSQIFNLIFAPGFSTAEKVTDLSGRGVGLDVVRRNIDKLRGKIEITSVPEKGSTFSIFLPLTLAIIEGLLVGVGDHRYIIPTLSVCESFQPRAEMISTVHGGGELINVRGRLIPLLRLYEHLGVRPATSDATSSIAVVVESGNAVRCLLVDKLIGKQEVVIKSLGETFRANRHLSGAAILGDGRVGLILDPQSLVNLNTESLAKAA